MLVTLSVKGLTRVLVLFPCALTSSCLCFSSMLFVHSPVYCGVLFSLNAFRPSSLSLVGIT